MTKVVFDFAQGAVVTAQAEETDTDVDVWKSRSRLYVTLQIIQST